MLSEVEGAEMFALVCHEFMLSWAKHSGLHFHLCWDPQLQGKAGAVQMG